MSPTQDLRPSMIRRITIVTSRHGKEATRIQQNSGLSEGDLHINTQMVKQRLSSSESPVTQEAAHGQVNATVM